ncbi:HAMP domain-containing protein [bacterium]|nr:MAG: HAMP domain-containing protein [bacterium]
MDTNELKSSVKNNILISFLLLILLWSIVLASILNHAIRSEITYHGLPRQLEKVLLAHATTIVGLTTILGSLFAILLSMFIAKKITSPFPKLLKGIEELARGDLDSKLEIEADNEFGLLAKAFNDMKQDLKNMTVSRNELSNESMARRKTQDFLNTILDSVGPLVVIDLQYKIVMANKAYCEHVGMELADIIGKRCYEISHKSDVPCYINHEDCGLLKVIETRKHYSAIHEHKKGDGFIYAQVDHYPVKGEKGSVVMIIETIVDITEKHNMETELQNRLHELERFNRLAIGRELKMVELKEELEKTKQSQKNGA